MKENTIVNHRLLVLDVDGTLLNSDHELTLKTISALIKVQQFGVRIVLMSGRPLCSLEPIAERIDLARYGGYIIAYNGSLVIEAKTGKHLLERRVNPNFIPYLNPEEHGKNFALITYDQGTLLTDSPENRLVISEARLNNMEIVYQPDLIKTLNFWPYKIVMVGDDPPTLEEQASAWNARFEGMLKVLLSKDYFLEVLPGSTDKLTALRQLLERLKLDFDSVVAFGDGIHDVSILQMAGLGVAMGNASEYVKACADKVVATNDEDGLAEALADIITAKINNIAVPIRELNKRTKNSLIGTLGIDCTYASPNRVEAMMPVDERTRTPFGILHGGASLALAETVAGIGSMFLAKTDETVVGMEVCGNHFSSAFEGDVVYAIAKLMHGGRSSHVWNVDIFSSNNKHICSVRVLNSVTKRKSVE